MNFTLSSAELSSALKTISKAVSPTHSKLSNVLIKTENNCLVISATDLTTFISLKIPANIIEHGSLCIPALLTTKIVKVLPLKLKYGSFKDAKAALGIKAVSWDKLVEKINAQSTPQIVTNSQPSVEKVIAQLKAKYGKLTYAKSELKIKAVSWVKLAETYMAA